ncbi:hypothetical protein OROGR_004225 [Orobanche gracilis]
MPHHQLHLARPGRDVRLWNPKLVCQFQSVEKSSRIVNSKVLPWPPCRFTKNFGKKFYVCPSWNFHDELVMGHRRLLDCRRRLREVELVFFVFFLSELLLVF